MCENSEIITLSNGSIVRTRRDRERRVLIVLEWPDGGEDRAWRTMTSNEARRLANRLNSIANEIERDDAK